MHPISVKNIPDPISKPITKNISQRKIYTKDIIVNCSTPFCFVINDAIKHEFGQIIYFQATVIRTNNYKITGYEKFIGNKTNFICVTGWSDIENRNELVEFSPFTEYVAETQNVFYYYYNTKYLVITSLTNMYKFILETTNPSDSFALVQLLITLKLTLINYEMV